MWLAAEPPVNALDWVQFGVLGVVVLGFLLGFIWPKPSVEKLLRDLDRRDAQVDALINTYQDKVIPVLTEVLDLLRRMGEDTEPPRVRGR